MARRQIFTLFHPSAFTPSRSCSFSQTTKRYSSSRWEPFILPRIAIDLDAPDNPAVREYNEEIDDILPKHALATQKATAKALERKEIEENTHVQFREWRDLRTSPLDLITYALFGKSCILNKKPTAMPWKAQQRLRKVLRQRAVDYQDTADTTVRKLTENFEWTEPWKFVGLAKLGEGEKKPRRVEIRKVRVGVQEMVVNQHVFDNV
jgi:hypothetical protein